MKFLAVPILILAMLAQTFMQGFYYLSYLADKSSFEKNCINKAKTWMHCNGKCQLMKKFIERQKKEQQAPELKLATQTMDLFVIKNYYHDIFFDAQQQQVFTFCTIAAYKSNFPDPIFHPPAL